MNLVPLILPDGFVCPYIYLANSNVLRADGLRYCDCLGPGWGMLFDFGCPGVQRMTLAGCRIPLDVIWLGRLFDVRQVITAAIGAGHLLDHGAASWCVLELAAGQAAAHGVIPGSQIRFVTPSF